MHSKDTQPSIADLYPGRSPEEHAEIADAFDRYLKLVVRIADGALADPDLADLVHALTKEPTEGTVETERSNIVNDKTSNV